MFACLAFTIIFVYILKIIHAFLKLLFTEKLDKNIVTISMGLDIYGVGQVCECDRTDASEA